MRKAEDEEAIAPDMGSVRAAAPALASTRSTGQGPERGRRAARRTRELGVERSAARCEAAVEVEASLVGPV